MAENIQCLRCGAHNSITALQCVRCGELLPVTRVHDDVPDLTVPPDAPAPPPDVKPNRDAFLDLPGRIPPAQEEYEEELARNLNRASYTLMRLGCGLWRLSCCLLWLILGAGLFFIGVIFSWLGAG